MYIQPRSREDLLMIMRSQFQRPCDKKRVTLGTRKTEKEVEPIKSRVK